MVKVVVLKVVVALLAAAAAPATLFTVLGLLRFAQAGPLAYIQYVEVLGPWLMVFVVALFHAVVFGLPVYFMARSLHFTHWLVSLAGGFLIGALPIAICGWPDPGTGNYQVWDGEKMVDHFVIIGLSIHAEYVHFLGVVCEMGFCGTAGGFAAWLVWRYFPSPREG